MHRFIHRLISGATQTCNELLKLLSENRAITKRDERGRKNQREATNLENISTETQQMCPPGIQQARPPTNNENKLYITHENCPNSTKLFQITLKMATSSDSNMEGAQRKWERGLGPLTLIQRRAHHKGVGRQSARQRMAR